MTNIAAKQQGITVISFYVQFNVIYPLNFHTVPTLILEKQNFIEDYVIPTNFLQINFFQIIQ